MVGVSTVILEILENGKDVFHICEDPIFHVPSNKIWKKIIVKKIDKGIYHYSLKYKGSLIKFGKKIHLEKVFLIFKLVEKLNIFNKLRLIDTINYVPKRI